MSDKLRRGTIVKFGTYPQTSVTDKQLLKKLSTVEKEWVPFNYNDRDCECKLYADITCGNHKYRLIKNEYDSDGYACFRYDPIEWIVYNPDECVLLSKNLLDGQPIFDNLKRVEEYDDDYEIYKEYDIIDGKQVDVNYTGNYNNTTVRAWLNSTFCNTAFSENECKRNLRRLPVTEKNDKISLLSSEEIAGYCIACGKYRSDYCKAIGVDDYSGYYLRNPQEVSISGVIDGYLWVDDWNGHIKIQKGQTRDYFGRLFDIGGIRPIICVDESLIKKPNITDAIHDKTIQELLTYVKEIKKVDEALAITICDYLADIDIEEAHYLLVEEFGLGEDDYYHHLKKAADLGYEPAQLRYYIESCSSSKFEDGMKYLKMAVEQGSEMAIRLMNFNKQMNI